MLLLAHSAAAQEPPTSQPPAAEGGGQKVTAAEEPAEPLRSFFPELFHNLGSAVKKMPRRNSLYWLAGGGALALAVHPADHKINDRLRGSSIADAAFVPGKYIGSFPVLFATGVGTYLVGNAKHMGRVRHLGMDLIEGVLLSGAVTQGLKVAVRRERPLRDDGTRSKGFAFPSGHSSDTFAAATILQQHLGWRAALPTYTVASYVAISRLHDQRHFASDVVFGAALGIIVGRSVTWHGRHYYSSPMLLPGGGGIMVSVNPNRSSGATK